MLPTWTHLLFPKRLRRAARPDKRRGFRCLLEHLENRVVPSTSPLDLTTAGSKGFINGAIFRDMTTSPTGSGNIHSFVRIDGKGDMEQGYNTDYRPYSV